MAAARRIEACRLCAARELTGIIDFGSVALGNNLQEDAAAARAAARYALDLNRCGACGHFQLGHAVAPDILYATNYTYLSGIGASFVKHFAAYADWVGENCTLPPRPFIVDVGSNDGTALKAFKARGFEVFGVDPAALPARLANDNGIATLHAFFDKDAVRRIKQERGEADFVTSHNVLAHVDDLAETFADIHDLLKPGGYFCFEVGYFREVLKNNLFDTIYHEHLDYHHAGPLVRHLMALGFSIEQIVVVAAQGGSLRMLCRKDGLGQVSAAAQAFLDSERGSVVNDAAYLRNWRHEIEARMGLFAARVREKAKAGLSIAGYGAPTKATLLMTIAGIGSEIAYVAEDNELKAGRFLPSSGIAILPTATLFAKAPDVVVVFAWNFAEDIIAKLRGRFAKPVEVIVPLPELRVVTL